MGKHAQEQQEEAPIRRIRYFKKTTPAAKLAHGSSGSDPKLDGNLRGTKLAHGSMRRVQGRVQVMGLRITCDPSRAGELRKALDELYQSRQWTTKAWQRTGRKQILSQSDWGAQTWGGWARVQRKSVTAEPSKPVDDGSPQSETMQDESSDDLAEAMQDESFRIALYNAGWIEEDPLDPLDDRVARGFFKPSSGKGNSVGKGNSEGKGKSKGKGVRTPSSSPQRPPPARALNHSQSMTAWHRAQRKGQRPAFQKILLQAM